MRKQTRAITYNTYKEHENEINVLNAIEKVLQENRETLRTIDENHEKIRLSEMSRLFFVRPFQIVKRLDAAHLPLRLFAAALLLIQVAATHRAQSFAVLRTQHPDW